MEKNSNDPHRRSKSHYITESPHFSPARYLPRGTVIEVDSDLLGTDAQWGTTRVLNPGQYVIAPVKSHREYCLLPWPLQVENEEDEIQGKSYKGPSVEAVNRKTLNQWIQEGLIRIVGRANEEEFTFTYNLLLPKS